MLEGIAGSKSSIRLETYIYTGGGVGLRFREALIVACQRGVKVQVLVDALGSVTLPASFWEPLQAAGGDFRWFNPLRRARWSYRDHRKVLVCDDTLAYVGGFNVSEEYEGDGVTRGWRDLGLRIEGDLAVELGRTFDSYFVSAEFHRKQRRQLRRAQKKNISGPDWKLLLSASFAHRTQLKRSLAGDLAASSSVQIISAYFLPTWRLRTELQRVCRRGGRVQLILAGKSDVLLSLLASRRLYQPLMRSGIEIYEYQPQILHAKLFIMDDVVYVGSANLDTRSLHINHELLVRLKDENLVAGARSIFESDLQRARRVNAADWPKSRTFVAKLQERWAYFLLARLDPYLARLQVRLLR